MRSDGILYWKLTESNDQQREFLYRCKILFHVTECTDTTEMLYILIDITEWMTTKEDSLHMC